MQQLHQKVRVRVSVRVRVRVIACSSCTRRLSTEEGWCFTSRAGSHICVERRLYRSVKDREGFGSHTYRSSNCAYLWQRQQDDALWSATCVTTRDPCTASPTLHCGGSRERTERAAQCQRRAPASATHCWRLALALVGVCQRHAPASATHCWRLAFALVGVVRHCWLASDRHS